MASLSTRMVVAAGCAVLAGAASWSDLLLVVAGHVVPGWAVGFALLLVSSALMLIPALPRGAATDRTKRARHTWNLLLALPSAAAGLGCVPGAVADLYMSAGYHVLEPGGPGGCRAVVREASYLFGGRSDVYAVDVSGIAWRPESSWTADDGHRPIASGSYGLRWDGHGGVLTVDGGSDGPSRRSVPHLVDCE